MTARNELYRQVVDVTADYLGPAAPRFIDRQVESHLDKKPGQFNADDLPTLIRWATVAMASLTDSADLVNEYKARLEGLINGRR